MAIAYERLLPDWPGFMVPERWRRFFDVDPEQDRWLEDVEITVSDGVLHFDAHREVSVEQKTKKGYFSEFRYGKWSRTVRLPEGVTPDDLKATYEDGILEVRIPILPVKEPEVKTIPVTKV